MADNFPQINALNSKCEIAKQLVRIPGFSRTTSVVSCATSIKVRNWDHKKSDRKMNQCQIVNQFTLLISAAKSLTYLKVKNIKFTSIKQLSNARSWLLSILS